jgi:hypothetical protein
MMIDDSMLGVLCLAMVASSSFAILLCCLNRKDTRRPYLFPHL